MEKSAPSVPNTGSNSNSVSGSSLLEQVLSNKTYLYIVLAVVVLAAIGFYLYKKQLLGGKEEQSQKKEAPKEILQPTKEYYLVDPNGNPILVNKYFSKILQSEMQDQSQIQHQQQAQHQKQAHGSIMVNNQIPLPPPPSNYQVQRPVQQKQRPRLSHPGEVEIDNVNVTEREDENVATQDLTQTEIDELRKELEKMQRKQSAPITAQNEGNDAEAEF